MLVSWDCVDLLVDTKVSEVLSALKMEVLCSSETLVSTNTSTRRYNPKDQQGHLRRCENLKSHKKD
jgi:hypothetical protein